MAGGAVTVDLARSESLAATWVQAACGEWGQEPRPVELVSHLTRSAFGGADQTNANVAVPARGDNDRPCLGRRAVIGMMATLIEDDSGANSRQSRHRDAAPGVGPSRG